jgi:hypothetical protein
MYIDRLSNVTRSFGVVQYYAALMYQAMPLRNSFRAGCTRSLDQRPGVWSQDSGLHISEEMLFRK